MSDLDRAKALLENDSYTCVLCRGDTVYTSRLSGIAPMMQLIGSNTDLTGFRAADKLVGKAAAMLFLLAGVKEVYAGVMSHSAMQTLQQHQIPFSYGEAVQTIINRTGTGPCPMEQTVSAISDPQQAYAALQITVQRLKAGRSSPST